MPRNVDWDTIKKAVVARAAKRGLSSEYIDRLNFEIKEIEKQGANAYWTDKFNSNFKYNTNKNGLVLPWLLDLTPIDPLASKHEIVRSVDQPDIDIDCLPGARDKIKAYAAQKYGEEHVCSVGAWITYKFKMALQDAARGLGAEVKEAMAVTKVLPDDVDDLKDGGQAACSKCGAKHNKSSCPSCGSQDMEGITIGRALEEYEPLKIYNDAHPDIVDAAVKLLGKIRAMGKHAGGIIITNKILLGNIPMGISKGSDGVAQWTSMWTEGRNTQLSKLGYVKWDLLGLKTLQYIYETCKLIECTRGHKFNAAPWANNDPENNSVGWYSDPDGKRCNVPMDDKIVFKMLNELKLETVFQFETDVQRNVLANGVRDYYDLQVFNAMGHPGPIAFIPEYIARRDDIHRTWMSREHHEIANELLETHGLIVYQEQLAKLWQKFASFTAPEAEAARKAVAKKWVDKLKPVKEQWLKNASKTIGPEWAEKMWDRMQTFGRYAFNRSHSCSYIMEAYWCAWLKAHFAPEWWASVMSDCDSDRIPKYMNTARREGVKFGPIDANNLTIRFSVDSSLKVTPGLTSVKGIGDKAAANLINLAGAVTDIDTFIDKNGRNKRVMEPLVKLGAFERYHTNLRATWMWYQYKYGSGKDITELRKNIKGKLLAEWTDEKLQIERARQISEFKKLWPKRKTPAKLLNYQPKANDTREAVMALYPEDFSLEERLAFEKQYLGYFWHSPMDLYHTKPGRTIDAVKNSLGRRGKVEAVIEKLTISKTKDQKKMGRLKISDGISDCTIVLWANQLKALEPHLNESAGFQFDLKYDKDRDSFTLSRNSNGGTIIPVPLVAINEKSD